MERVVSADRGFEKDGEADETVSGKRDGSGSGATDIFGIVTEPTPSAPAWETVREMPAVTSAPAPQEAGPRVAQAVDAPLQSGGFTQLLRALNYEQIKPQPPIASAESGDATVQKTATGARGTEPAAAAGVSPVTESVTMAALRAMDARRSGAQQEPQVAASAVKAEGSSPAQVTSFQQVAVPQAQPQPASTGPAPGSFTQMFQSLNAPQQEKPKEPDNVTAAVVPSAMPDDHLPADARRTAEIPLPAAAAAPGSFTQMFQSLGRAGEETGVPAEPVRPAAAPSSFTAIFGAASSGPASTPAAEPAAAAGSTTRVFRTFDGGQTDSLIRPVTADGPGTPPPAPMGEGAPASFTQIFSAAGSGPIAGSEPAATHAPEAGSFTQAFRTLDQVDAGLAAKAYGSGPEPAVPSGPGSFTQMFQAPQPGPVAEAPPAVQPHAAGGSFTDVFRSLDAGASAHHPAATAQPASGGSFTEIFRSLEPEQPTAHTSSAAPAADAAGTFTEIFRTLDPAAPAARQDPAASFTQIFGTGVPAPLPATPQGAGLPGDSGASQMFSTYRPPAEAVRSPELPHAGYAPSGPPPAARPPSGGLTQLLRTLDSPTQPSSVPSPRAPEPSPQQPGSFTSVYGKLDASPSGAPAAGPAGTPMYTPPATAGREATQPFRPAVPTPPTVPAVSAGPSEFTRILNASQFREEALRGGGGVAGQAPAAVPPSGGAGSPQAMSAPAMPAMPQWTPPVAPAAAPAAAFAPPAAPQMPALPQVKLPEVPKPAAAGALQQYLPLLLILIIFLLLAILVAVIFLMKK